MLSCLFFKVKKGHSSGNNHDTVMLLVAEMQVVIINRYSKFERDIISGNDI